MDKTTGIIGASSVGASVFSNIVRIASKSAGSIELFDPNPPGHGTVFNPEDLSLLCNTSAGIGSLIADIPSDFTNYLASCHRPAKTDGYLPRDIVGEYVRARYEEHVDLAAAQGIKVTHHPTTVNSILCRDDGSYEVRQDDGLAQNVDQLVICIGSNDVKLADGLAPHSAHPRLIRSPYPATQLRQRIKQRNCRVLVLGAGLSAIDAAVVLCHDGHSVTLASRSGKLPAVRNRTLPPTTAIPSVARMAELDPNDSLLDRKLTRIVVEAVREIGPLPLRRQLSHTVDPVGRLREEVELVATGRCYWQDVVLPLIEQLNLWTADLPLTARNSLLSSYRPVMWRYITSMAIDNARRLLQYIDDGLLTVGAYDPNHVMADSTGFGAVMRYSGLQRFDYVVNAAGINPPTLHLDTQTVYLRNPPKTAKAIDHLGSDLRLRLNPSAAPEAIWLAGQTTYMQTPFANFLLQAVGQAGAIARHLSTI